MRYQRSNKHLPAKCNWEKKVNNYADFVTHLPAGRQGNNADEKQESIQKYNDYPESDLTEKIIKCAYLVYRELDYGLPEKVYQKAFAECLEDQNLGFTREKFGKILFDKVQVGKYFLDFFVENKIAIEFKVRNDIYETDVIQLLNYIESEKIKIGLLIVFTKKGLKIKRLANSSQR